jgi:hypothetical protein
MHPPFIFLLREIAFNRRTVHIAGMSLMCVAMYHLLPKISLTPALRSP